MGVFATRSCQHQQHRIADNVAAGQHQHQRDLGCDGWVYDAHGFAASRGFDCSDTWKSEHRAECDLAVQRHRNLLGWKYTESDQLRDMEFLVYGSGNDQQLWLGDDVVSGDVNHYGTIRLGQRFEPTQCRVFQHWA